MTGSPAEVAAALAEAARRLEVDYRDVEERVRHLARTERWFRGWARETRPRTHLGTRANALLWLWLEEAHGHITTAPIAADPWSYRKFARLLTGVQATTLAGAIATSMQSTQESR